MNRPLNLRTLTIYYYRYKDTPYFAFGAFGLVLVISFLLVVFLVIPQIQQFVSLQREIESVEATISTMESNREYLQSISEAKEQEQSEIVRFALPIIKDYAGIYTAIVTTASQTGVSLANFQYEVGSLNESVLEGNVVGEVRVTLSVSGSPTRITEYLKKLEETLPLSTVTFIAGDNLTSQLEVAFLYGGEQLIQIDPKQPLPRLSAEKQALLGTLSSYRPQVEPVFVQSTPSTSSAESGFSQSPF